MENMKKKFAKKKKEGEEGEEGAEGGEEGGEETEVKISLLGGTLVRIYWQLLWRIYAAHQGCTPLSVQFLPFYRPQTKFGAR